ncbi:MAG: hypothetical protein EBZ24_08875, partial [Synechococcaceae bacterium WB9_4xB_025]|nr:hypothetical protein [Synechococcaceae bacterium WB9_4xB_025]
MALLRFLALPFRAPLLLVLFVVAILLGHHWTIFQQDLMNDRGIDPQLFWTVEVVQALVVVV